MRVLLALPLPLMLLGCGTARQSPGALQQYQSMKTELLAVTRDSTLCAQSSITVSRDMAKSRAVAARRASGALSVRAARLRTQAREVAGRVARLIQRTSPSSGAGRYLRRIEKSLHYDELEGAALRAVSTLIRADPWLESGNNSRRLRRLSRRARWASRMATAEALAAGRLIRAHRDSFRYTPVRISRS